MVLFSQVRRSQATVERYLRTMNAYGQDHLIGWIMLCFVAAGSTAATPPSRQETE